MRTTRTDKLVDLPSLLSLRQAYRQAQRTVVWTNGCFDLLHAGHVLSLQAASRLGDVLVVGLNSDESVRQLKGDGRPIFPVLARAEVLAALECVDHVLVFADRTPTAVLARLRPDVHCKGADYAPPHGQPVPERAVVEAHGGRVAFLPLVPGLSTTALLRRLARLAPTPEPDPTAAPTPPPPPRPAPPLGFGETVTVPSSASELSAGLNSNPTTGLPDWTLTYSACLPPGLTLEPAPADPVPTDRSDGSPLEMVPGREHLLEVSIGCTCLCHRTETFTWQSSEAPARAAPVPLPPGQPGNPPPSAAGSLWFPVPRNEPDDPPPEPDVVLAPQQDGELPDKTVQCKASGAT